jgi:hypothetical protein
MKNIYTKNKTKRMKILIKKDARLVPIAHCGGSGIIAY